MFGSCSKEKGCLETVSSYSLPRMTSFEGSHLAAHRYSACGGVAVFEQCCSFKTAPRVQFNYS